MFGILPEIFPPKMYLIHEMKGRKLADKTTANWQVI
jgi:hypothetical protein